MHYRFSKAPVAKEDRSKMNAVFIMDDAALGKRIS